MKALPRKSRKTFKLPNLVHFYWMGSYWSTSMEVWEQLELDAADKNALSLHGCRKLKTKPKGTIPQLG